MLDLNIVSFCTCIHPVSRRCNKQSKHAIQIGETEKLNLLIGENAVKKRGIGLDVQGESAERALSLGHAILKVHSLILSICILEIKTNVTVKKVKQYLICPRTRGRFLVRFMLESKGTSKYCGDKGEQLGQCEGHIQKDRMTDKTPGDKSQTMLAQ